MVYAARFHRPRDIWYDAWAECMGIRVTYRLGVEAGFAKMAAELIKAGHSDGPICFTEVGVKAEFALITNLESIAVLATGYQPLAPEREDRIGYGVVSARQLEAFRFLLNDDIKGWNDSHGKTRNIMVATGWVRLEGTGKNQKPLLTDLGRKVAASKNITVTEAV